MNSIWLVEVAALLAGHGKAIAYSRMGLPLPALNAYWIANRQRADQWHEAIHIYRSQLETAGMSKRLILWGELRGVISEVLLSEVLTRVLAAVGAELERENIDDDVSPITSSVASTHAEARQRCLQLMVDGPNQPTSDAVQLNRLRLYLDEWTDMLLAQIGDCHGARLYCHRLTRMQEWAEEFDANQESDFGGIDMQLRLLGMRRWLARSPVIVDANPNLNQSIGRASMAMLRPEWFDSLGCMKTLASHRIQAIISETDGMITNLLSNSSPTTGLLNAHQNLEHYRNAKSGDPFRR